MNKESELSWVCTFAACRENCLSQHRSAGYVRLGSIKLLATACGQILPVYILLSAQPLTLVFNFKLGDTMEENKAFSLLQLFFLVECRLAAQPATPKPEAAAKARRNQPPKTAETAEAK